MNAFYAKFGCIVTLTGFMATGCATKTGTGALVGAGSGAAVGAGLGALMGGGKGAVVGAGVGAAAGAGVGALVGNYMDKQEKALKEVKGANVERKGDQLVVKFNSAILFDTGKADLKPQSEKDLSEFANVLKEYKETDLVIEGHTDNVGKKDKNKKLSNQRAESVVAFLEKHGVERSRMKSLGLADERPVADNTTAEGKAANRRVEVNIAANESLKKQDAEAAQASADQGQAQQASKKN